MMLLILINNELHSLKQEFIWEHLLHSVYGTLHTPPGSQSPVRKHFHLCSNLPVNSETTGLFVAFSPGRFSSKSVSLVGQNECRYECRYEWVEDRMRTDSELHFFVTEKGGLKPLSIL